MSFIKATDVKGKQIIINTYTITEVIPRQCGELIDIFFNSYDGEGQACNLIQGSVESFMEGLETGEIKAN